MPSPGSRRWLRRGLVAVTVLLLALGGTVAFILLHAPGNVSHPNLEFTRPTVTQPPPPPPPKRKTAVVDDFAWPWYGYDDGRTRFFPNSGSLDPPLRVGWSYNDYGLLEFPPVIYGDELYLVDDNGWARAINKRNGHVLWEHQVGTLAAASPAVGAKDGLVFVPLLSTDANAAQTQNPGNGRFVALSMKTGRVVWSHPVPSGTESSPLVSNHTVYFGDQSGTVYSLYGPTGSVIWTYKAHGAIKGGPALVNGVLFFGDYAGRAYALNAGNGHEIWAVGTNGAHFGFGSGQFYSTPAVAFGRVYMGNTDGRVYSFGARDGALAWATGTGNYVYGSAAVSDTPGLGPTVYIGSYDGTFYAFNAQSGSIRWTHNAGEPISGSATIVGDVVYFSVLHARTTAGLDVRTGRQVFSFPDGIFNPVIADHGAIYMVGYSIVYQMLPQRGHTPPPPPPRRARRRAPGPSGRSRARRAITRPHNPSATLRVQGFPGLGANIGW
jgi:outer membrane protein assembly factor BamB